MGFTSRNLPKLPEIEPLDTGPLEDARAELKASRRELGVTPQMTIVGHLKDARRELCEAKVVAWHASEDDLYVWLCKRIGELDGMRRALKQGDPK